MTVATSGEAPTIMADGEDDDDDSWALVKQQVSASSSLAGPSPLIIVSPAATAISTLTFAVRQSSSLEALETLLFDVSTPSSPSYGQHLSFQQVGALVANPEATAAVLQWIHASLPDALAVNATAFGEYISVCASVESLGLLLNASLLAYARPSRPADVIWRSADYSLPDDVSPHIEAVFDLVDKPPRLRGGPVLVPQPPLSAANISSSASSTIMTPARLRFLYNMGSHAGSAQATQAVFGTIGQAFAPEDIAMFQSSQHLADNPVATLRNSRAHNQSYCASSDLCGEASLDLEYMMAVAPRSPTTYWYASSFAPMSPFVDWIVNVSASARPPLVHSISYGCGERFVSAAIRRAFDLEAVKLGLRGVSIIVASGDDGASQGSTQSAECGYFAEWPASSAYVTAVGATMGGLGADGPERVCSSKEGSAITSGGGFSAVSPRPAYQAAAVEGYRQAVSGRSDAPVNGAAPSPGLQQGFSWQRRAYPDVSMCGDRFLVAVGGKWYVYSGTSASSPVLAGVVSLSNAQRLSKGLAAVGFLNPLLYAGWASFANDVTAGDNHCSRGGVPCCPRVGFPAAPGWDPATGVGTVDVARFLPYSLASARVAVGAAPTPKPSASALPSPAAGRPPASSSAAPTRLPTPPLSTRGPSPSPSPSPSAAPAMLQASLSSSSSSGPSDMAAEYAFFFVVLALTAALCLAHRVIAPMYATVERVDTEEEAEGAEGADGGERGAASGGARFPESLEKEAFNPLHSAVAVHNVDDADDL